MAKYDANWWLGENSLYAKSGIKEALTGVKVDVSAQQGGVDWRLGSGGFQEAEILKMGFMLLGLYVIVRMVG